MAQGKNLRAVGDRIEELTQELSQLSDTRMRDRAEELVRLVMELYGGAFARILEIAAEKAPADETLVERLAADDLVASLLILHGLHPLDIETRITRALDHVRPYLGSHGGDVKLLSVNDRIVQLRLEGSCHGCPSSTVTMKLAIEKAIEEAAPEVIRIEVEGANQPAMVPSFEAGAVSTSSQPPMQEIPINSGEWVALRDMPEFAGGDLAAIEAAGIQVIVCRVGESFYAYQDSCPSCGGTLRGGALHSSILTCPSCGRAYDVRRAGQCMDASELHMEPLPLLANPGGIRIAVPAMIA